MLARVGRMYGELVIQQGEATRWLPHWTIYTIRSDIMRFWATSKGRMLCAVPQYDRQT